MLKLRNIDPVIKGIEEQGEKRLLYGAEWLKNVEAQINDYPSEKRKSLLMIE